MSVAVGAESVNRPVPARTAFERFIRWTIEFEHGAAEQFPARGRARGVPDYYSACRRPRRRALGALPAWHVAQRRGLDGALDPASPRTAAAAGARARRRVRLRHLLDALRLRGRRGQSVSTCVPTGSTPRSAGPSSIGRAPASRCPCTTSARRPHARVDARLRRGGSSQRAVAHRPARPVPRSDAALPASRRGARRGRHQRRASENTSAAWRSCARRSTRDTSRRMASAMPAPSSATFPPGESRFARAEAQASRSRTTSCTGVGSARSPIRCTSGLLRPLQRQWWMGPRVARRQLFVATPNRAHHGR